MRQLLLLLLGFFLQGREMANAQNYNKLMGKAIKKSIGTDLKGYQTFSYPTDNYGLITSFNKSAMTENFICDMWNCIGVDNINSKSENWLDMNGFAAVGGGGSIDLSEKDQRKFALNILLPKIYDMIGFSGKIKNDKTTQVTVTIGKGYIRMLRKKPILDYIKSSSGPLKNAYDNNNLVIIVADCVIDGLSVAIQVDKKDSLALESKLQIPANTVAGKIFSDASLSLAITKDVSGKYTFKVSHPVIYARLAKKQPISEELEGDTSITFDKWLDVNENEYLNHTVQKK
ncbi:hypothetical protein [Pedobacter nyackensis]|uniref:hypothetical protein n=1 Tax=Pedobacter nyackensis TaxID=475255 RepID=UPI00292F8B0A|nr:hypothetical protein [Pedobacter nyackensis]